MVGAISVYSDTAAYFEETPLPVFKVKSSYLKFSLASSDFYKFVYLCNRLFHVDTKQFAQYKVLNRWSIKAKLLFVWWLSRYLESTTAKVCGRSWEGVKNPEMCSVDIALYACCVHSITCITIVDDRWSDDEGRRPTSFVESIASVHTPNTRTNSSVDNSMENHAKSWSLTYVNYS